MAVNAGRLLWVGQPKHFLRIQGSGKRLLETSSAVPGVLVPNAEVKSFIERSMRAVGTKPDHATSLADNLVMADYRGHFSHGLNRLEMYVKDIESGITVSNLEPKILRETAAIAHVDGQNVLGPVVGNFCMKAALKKSKDVGIGFVVAKGSNHYGIAGFYSLQASKVGHLGLSFTNTSPLVIPTRGRKVTLGTNPLTLAAPGKGNDSFVLDMATSAVALGKIELSDVKKEPIPPGWGANSKGKVTNNPREVITSGGLLPLGGSELTSGYKGYGLAMLVEIFCGILAGAEYGPNIRKWKETNRIANLGQCFIAINPDAFEPGFTDRMQKLMDICRTSELAEGETEILVAGDPERKHMAKCDKAGGIWYHPNVIAILDKLADRLKIAKIASCK
jgi:LDH2 family malate/lactate/ureidoglycolate dehydrogenase